MKKEEMKEQTLVKKVVKLLTKEKEKPRAREELTT
jgi:hypothetical protein